VANGVETAPKLMHEPRMVDETPAAASMPLPKLTNG